MARETDNEKQWHLDRKVPIALILTIAVNIGASVWWARGIQGDQANLDRRVTILETGAGATIADRTKIAILENNLAALKEQVTESRAVLEEIRTFLIQERAKDGTPKVK